MARLCEGWFFFQTSPKYRWVIKDEMSNNSQTVECVAAGEASGQTSQPPLLHSKRLIGVIIRTAGISQIRWITFHDLLYKLHAGNLPPWLCVTRCFAVLCCFLLSVFFLSALRLARCLHVYEAEIATDSERNYFKIIIEEDQEEEENRKGCLVLTLSIDWTQNLRTSSEPVARNLFSSMAEF